MEKLLTLPKCKPNAATGKISITKFLIERVGFLLFLAGALSSPTHSQVIKPDLRVAVIAPRGVDAARESWRPLMDDMEKKTGYRVELFVGKEQKEVRDALIQGTADIGYMGNVAALEVFESGKGEVFAGLIRDDGSTGYHSIILSRKGSGLNNLADIQIRQIGKAIAFGDSKSTSGFIVPNYYVWARQNKNPEQLFDKVLRGDHKTNLLRVFNGEVDVAVSNDVEYAIMVKANPKLLQDLQVIWKSNEIPESPLMNRKDLDQTKKRKVIEFLTSYGKESAAEKKILHNINSLRGFQKSTNSRLRIVADIEMFSVRTAIANDKSLNPAERAIRASDVIKRAAKMDQRLTLPD